MSCARRRGTCSSLRQAATRHCRFKHPCRPIANPNLPTPPPATTSHEFFGTDIAPRLRSEPPAILEVRSPAFRTIGLYGFIEFMEAVAAFDAGHGEHNNEKEQTNKSGGVIGDRTPRRPRFYEYRYADAKEESNERNEDRSLKATAAVHLFSGCLSNRAWVIRR